MLILLAGDVPAYLTDGVALVVAGALIAYICFRFKLVPIVGFLIAGVLIGPNALGLVRNRELVNDAALVGVILLLFTIGIEFSVERLLRITRLILLGGGLQCTLAALSTGGARTGRAARRIRSGLAKWIVHRIPGCVELNGHRPQGSCRSWRNQPGTGPDWPWPADLSGSGSHCHGAHDSDAQRFRRFIRRHH